MRVRTLRRIVERFGATGVLLVGLYVLLRHGRQHRRTVTVAVSCVLLLFVSILWICRTHRGPRDAQKSPPTAAVPRVATAAVNEGPVQDDTKLGPAFPAADRSPGAADGDILFAAQFFRKSGRFYRYYDGQRDETLEDLGPSHLYRMRADGTGRRQLTWGPKSDYRPVVSPDGTCAAFLRSNWESYPSLCVVSADGGPARVLAALPTSAFYVHMRWSPDSRRIAVAFHPEAQDRPTVWIVSVTGEIVKRLPGVSEFAWSPDGRMYVCDDQDRALILNREFRDARPVRDVVYSAVWLNAHTLAGDVNSTNDFSRSDGPLRIIDDEGREQRQIPLSLIGRQNAYETFWDTHRWHTVPRHPSVLILEAVRDMSDGEHFGCYRVDLNTGQCRLLQDGRLIGCSWDGTRIAVADSDWVGPYKRGGRRAGPLQVVTISTGRTCALTSPLGSVEGGAWLTGRPQRAGPGRFLSAVERGDVEAVRRLVARGIDPDRRFVGGVTALMVAAADGRIALVDRLLRLHADANARDRLGRTALMFAVGAGKAADEIPSQTQRRIVLRLLAAGARVDASDENGETALTTASMQGRATIVACLLDNGAAVDRRDRSGATALMQAAEWVNPRTVEVLLRHGASPSIQDVRKETALSLLGRLNELSANPESKDWVKRLLVQAGAKEQAVR